MPSPDVGSGGHQQGLSGAAFTRLLDTLEGSATSQTELAGEIRAQARVFSELQRSIGKLTDGVERQAEQTARLFALLSGDRERDQEERTRRAKVQARVVAALWKVAEGPVGFLFLAMAAWVAVSWLGWTGNPPVPSW